MSLESILRFRTWLGRLRQLARCYLEKWTNRKAVYFIMTPEHGNLGDHAIAYAATKMLDQLHIPFITVSTERLREWQYKKLLHVMNGRPILINGGGNLGTIWFSLELIIRDVIRDNPDSNIMILPNTMYYHDDEKGRKELLATETIYNAHPRLTVYAREKITYQSAAEHFHRVKLVPDLALYLDDSKAQGKRSGCLLCLRSDREKKRTQEEDAEVLRQVRKLFGENIAYRDMNVGHPISPDEREAELKAQCGLFKQAQLVITDRLHGMIFCAITGTPCVVINSQSPKVKGCYEWIEGLHYVRFCDDVKHLTDTILTLPEEGQNYDNSHLIPYFDELKRDFLSVYENK